MQKALIITTHNKKKMELDDLLEHGWKVIHVCPMPSSCASGGTGFSYDPTCMVILEPDPEYVEER